ncbi:MAG TPA: M28 family metallopeptidase [Pyrinomonadaceae bacterium]|nr:M28 family metallopeptidase [Pyrinomonadaceae bacterium]
MDQAYIPATADSHAFVPFVKSNTLTSIGTLLVILTIVWLSVHQQSPPATVAADAPAEIFSSARAVKHIEAISTMPRPMGTQGNVAAREYIVSALRAAGLDPEVQQTTALSQNLNGIARAGAVHNVLARLKGTNNSKAVLLMSHYDSVPTAFGASDDAAGVASMLETLRALRASSTPLSNDVIFLFTDGEENGLLGAHAFVDEHQWAKDVGLVLNFEARGNSGPSIMFETSDENGWLIREFAKATPHPMANSLAYEVYKRLPNDTDFTVVKQAGLPGLNFAYIEGSSHYHTMLDRFAQLDERSLQHHGSYALALTRHFAGLNLNDRKETNAVYFDILGLTLVHYSSTLIIPLAIIVIISFAALIAFGLRKKRLTLKGIGFGFIALLSAMLVAAIGTYLVSIVISRLQSVMGFGPEAEVYRANTYLIGFVCLTIAMVTLLNLWFLKKSRTENLLAGGMLWWLILTVVTSLYLPGASYLFVWPLLFGMLGLLLMLTIGRDQRPERKLLLVGYLYAIPVIIVFVPVIYQIFQALSLSMIGPLMLAVALLCALLIPHLHLITTGKKWLLPSIAAVLGVGFIVAGLVASAASASQPEQDSLVYALNADTGKAVWASLDKSPDKWTTQFLSDAQSATLPSISAVNTKAQWLQREAPAEPLAAPDLKLLDDRSVEGTRTMQLHISSPRQAPTLIFYADSKMEIVSAQLNGKQMKLKSLVSDPQKDGWSMRYYAMPAEGIDLTMVVKALEPVKFRIVDQSYQFPSFMGSRFASRPDDIISAPASVTDSTFVSKSFIF